MNLIGESMVNAKEQGISGTNINLVFRDSLIQNIMAYHYNSMKTGTYPDNKINLNNTKRIFYDVYKAPDVDKRWEELIGLLKLYPYKKL